MSGDQPILFRFIITLVLSIMCLTTSACADIEPAVAEEGDASARNKLGLLYTEGAGVPQDYREAKRWFEKAAEQGYAEAQVNLGTLYLQGDGPPQSDQMALFWFRRAAGQGDAVAFAKLGMMYARERGVPQDFIQAHNWYNLAGVNGDRKAAEARERLANQMTSAQIAEAQQLAREWKPIRHKEVGDASRLNSSSPQFPRHGWVSRDRISGRYVKTLGVPGVFSPEIKLPNLA